MCASHSGRQRPFSCSVLSAVLLRRQQTYFAFHDERRAHVAWHRRDQRTSGQGTRVQREDGAFLLLEGYHGDDKFPRWTPPGGRGNSSATRRGSEPRQRNGAVIMQWIIDHDTAKDRAMFDSPLLAS